LNNLNNNENKNLNDSEKLIEVKITDSKRSDKNQTDSLFIETSLNLRKNMKANYGIRLIEGDSYKDEGPEYSKMFPGQTKFTVS